MLGIAYHITQRGNKKQEVFFVNNDKVKFLELFSSQSKNDRKQLRALPVGRPKKKKDKKKQTKISKYVNVPYFSGHNPFNPRADIKIDTWENFVSTRPYDYVGGCWFSPEYTHRSLNRVYGEKPRY